MPKSSGGAPRREPALDELGLGPVFFRSAVPHVVVDARGRIIAANLAFADLVAGPDLTDKRFVGVFPMAHSGAFWRALEETICYDRETAFTVEHGAKSGTARRLEAIATPFEVRIGERRTRCSLVTIMDTRTHVLAEERAHANYEVELAMRTRLEALLNAQALIGEAAVEKPNDEDDLLSVIAEQAAHVLDAPFAAIAMTEGAAGVFVDRDAGGLLDELDIDPAKVSEASLYAAADHAPSSAMTVAVEFHGAHMAALSVGRRRGRGFDEVDRRLLAMLAQRASTALEKTRAIRREAKGRSWLQAVIDSMPECVLIASGGGSVIVNQMARSFSARPQEQQAKITFVDANGNPIDGSRCPLSRALRGERVVDPNLVISTPRGPIPVIVNAAPVTDTRGQQVGAICIFRDLGMLRSLEKLRDEWAAVVAHDLKQPLSVIKMSDEVVSKAAKLHDEEGLGRAAERIRIAASRMSTMIEELVDTSLIESEHLSVRKKPTALSGCVREVVDQFQPQLDDREIRIDSPPDDDMVIEADEDRLEQVIGNLLSNAIKYGAAHRPIMIRLRRDRAAVRVVVENEGAALDSDDVENIFSRFFRTRAAAAGRQRGLGLGLYIARGLVRAHGGEIRAWSYDGHTCFEISLPAALDLRAH